MPTRTSKKANTSTSPNKKTEKTENTENVEKPEKAEKVEKVEEETKSGHKRQREASHDKVYFVERILDKKKFFGFWRYKVKWQGFSEEECTWEPAKNLESVKDMLIEFNKTFVPKEDEEEKESKTTTKEKTNHTKSASKPKSTSKPNKTKHKEEDTGKAQKFEKKEKKESKMGDPKKKVKTDKPEEITKVDCGHFKLGDHPKQIISAKQEHNKVIFNVQWKAREDGSVPSNTKMSNVELRKYDKDLLLDFYEARLKFVKPAKSARKMEEEQESKQSSQQEEGSNSEDQASENGTMDKEGDEKKANKQTMEEEGQDKVDTSSEEENKKENQLVETVPGEKQHTAEDIEHDIDDNDQPIYADINFNVAEDLRVETYAPTLIVNTQPGVADEKEVLQLESPQEISDDKSEKDVTIL